VRLSTQKEIEVFSFKLTVLLYPSSQGDRTSIYLKIVQQ